MRFAGLVRGSSVSFILVMAAYAQTAGPPTEMKSPADPTSQTHPQTTPPSMPTVAPTAPEKLPNPAVTPETSQPGAPSPAPVIDSKASASPASPVTKAIESDSAIPTTTIYPPSDPKTVLAPKLDPGPLPPNKSALIGGRVQEVDPIRNRMTVEVFGKGAGKMKVLFDPRTRFERNGVITNQTTIKKGEQVYLDTQLVNHKIFARDVYVRTATAVADAAGQIQSYNPKTRELVINDQLSQSPVTVRLAPNAVIKDNFASGSPADLQRYALVSVRLSPADKGRNVANEIDVIAKPGSQFTFYGTLTYLNLRSGIMAVDNKSDHKRYDIRFRPAEIGVSDDLKVGSEVAVDATFNGQDYTARTLTVTPSQTRTNQE